MSTITIPINKELESFIQEAIGSGAAENKAQLVRLALHRLQDEYVLARLREAEQDIASGNVFRGNLRALAKKMK